MTFLGWTRPVLHSVAEWLLDSADVSSTRDLSGVLVVVRGRRAGRRLLELLALKCGEQNRILVPPLILTPKDLVMRMTENLPNEDPVASPLAAALAWARALGDATEAERSKLFRRPGDDNAAPGLRALLGLGRHLDLIWQELGGAGLDFQDVIKVLGERFPNIADFEIPRWEVLGKLRRQANQILRSHRLTDPVRLSIDRARRGEITSGQRVVLVGVVELPEIVREFLHRLPQPPAVLVFAPESEREGFMEPGILRAEYWNSRAARLEDGQVHLVERDRDQAVRAAQVIKSWQDDGVAPTQMTVAMPDVEALPRLREALDTRGMKTRWAQGRPASQAPAFQLLRLVADYLDHEPDEPPRYGAVAALARHPDIPQIEPADWSKLDRFAAEHLPARFEPSVLGGVSDAVEKIHETLRRLIDTTAGEIKPVDAAEWTRDFLVRVYGEREENALSPDGRVAVHALELLRDLLAETMQGKMPWPAKVRPADFLHVLLGFVGDQPVPEPPEPGAVEIVGWLELLEDDAPAAVVTSLFEGAVPATISADPFLPGSLRQALSLGDNEARMARDAYALAAIMASRSGGRGGLALVAPRFDAAENPVRPTRLFLNGLQGEALARRVWHLAGKRPSELRQPLRDGPGFGPVPPKAESIPQSIPVTGFRDYIESPRKFFFLHVLGFKSENDGALELEGGDVGTLFHQVLAAFGADTILRDSNDEGAIQEFVQNRFDEIAQARFGPWAQPAVEIQLEEIRRRLRGFSRAQSSLRREGWTICYVEGMRGLSCPMAGLEDSGSLTIRGKIDRIDVNAAGNRWRIIDYKTSAKKRDPIQVHFRARSQEWNDLQLPLYLKLAAPYARSEWGVELTPENCELYYFQLPEDEGAAGLSAPFPAEMIEAAWGKAAEVVTRILRGEFEDNPTLRPDPAWNDPALLALCGQAGILASEPIPVPMESAAD